MLRLYVTIDTEYSAGFYRPGQRMTRVQNYAMSLLGRTDSGDAGIGYQMDILDQNGLKAVFFVDPMPALAWGQGAIDDIVGPIIERGHDVQLHLHPEWLEFVDDNPLGDRTGRNIGDFSLDDQRTLLNFGIDALTAAGAPRPAAFRAGNYGANDDTLRALAEVGIAYDTSLCPGIENSECRIELPEGSILPVRHCGIIEVPIGAVISPGGRKRHAQITALSLREMQKALYQCLDRDITDFTIVSHSFELLSRNRKSINRIVRSRFEKFCRWLGRTDSIQTATYRDNPPAVGGANDQNLPATNLLLTAERMAVQAASNLLYGAK